MRAACAIIVSQRTDGTHERRLVHASSARLLTPSFSLDGKRVVFVSIPGEEVDINLIGSDGRGYTPLGSGYEPSFAPDGQHILFSDAAYVNVEQIGSIDLATGASHDITANHDRSFSYSAPSYSPDGAHIVFGGFTTTGPGPGDFVADIYLLDADGSNERRLTDNGDSYEPAWGPAGG